MPKPLFRCQSTHLAAKYRTLSFSCLHSLHLRSTLTVELSSWVHPHCASELSHRQQLEGKPCALRPGLTFATMSEYWVSQAKFYCKFCNVWIADNKPVRNSSFIWTMLKYGYIYRLCFNCYWCSPLIFSIRLDNYMMVARSIDSMLTSSIRRSETKSYLEHDQKLKSSSS
jgi:U1 zinc finger